MTPARFSDSPGGLPRDRTVVIDLDDDVDAITVPGDVAALVEQTYGETERDTVYRVLALLIARLGSHTTVPAVLRWIGAEPDVLLAFPPETLHALARDPEGIGPGPVRIGPASRVP